MSPLQSPNLEAPVWTQDLISCMILGFYLNHPCEIVSMFPCFPSIGESAFRCRAIHIQRLELKQTTWRLGESFTRNTYPCQSSNRGCRRPDNPVLLRANMHLHNSQTCISASSVAEIFFSSLRRALAVAADISHPYFSSCAGLTDIWLFLSGGETFLIQRLTGSTTSDICI